jgi:glycosyltransferase involved in cell wall biosynthesis
VDDIRWFAPNRYCTLPVPALRRHGLSIALDEAAPARLAVAADGGCAVHGYEYARRHRCPLLLYLWDLPPWRLGNGKPDFVFEFGGRVRRWPRTHDRYPERAGYYSRVGYVARKATEVWCPSASTVADVAMQLQVEALRVPFCYDSDRFAASPGWRVAGGEPTSVFLSISRLVPHKNQAVILRAAARLTPKPAIQLIGQGPEASNLRRLAAELGVPLTLTDNWLSEAEIVAAYRSATGVICPSRFEGFGLTPMEGIAMGVPVIASDIPPHREFVRKLVRFFKPDDDRALADAMEAVRCTGGSTSCPSPSPLHDLTIDACAARFLPGLQRLLA